LRKVKKIIGAQFQTLFSTVFLLFDVSEYSNTFDYIKDTRPAGYFNNQKSLHIIFKTQHLKCIHFIHTHYAADNACGLDTSALCESPQ